MPYLTLIFQNFIQSEYNLVLESRILIAIIQTYKYEILNVINKAFFNLFNLMSSLFG